MISRDRAQELYAKGLTQQQIADVLGTSQSTIARWVNPDVNKRSQIRSRRWKEQAKRRKCSKCGSRLAYDRQQNRLCIRCGRQPYKKQAERAKRRAQEMLQLRKLGLTNPEIAQELGVTSAAVATLLHRSKRYGLRSVRSPYWDRKQA